MPYKIQPIRIHVSRCLFAGITSILPIVRRAYVALTVLVNVFSMIWYKIVDTMLSRGTPLHGIYHLSLVCTLDVILRKYKCLFKDITNSLHLTRKYAPIFDRGHYLFREANSFPRTLLEENCELWGTESKDKCPSISAKWRL